MFLKIDKFSTKTIRELLEFYKLGKSNIYKLQQAKAISVNDQIEDVNYRLQKNDYLKIDIEKIDRQDGFVYAKDIDILYEDEDILLVNKKANILVHSDGVTLDTMASRVNYYYQQKKETTIARPLHRLDFETTGILLFSKNLLVHTYLSSLFTSREVEKEYICLCKGRFLNSEGFIDSKIGRDRHQNKQRISKTGKDAYTEYEVIAAYRDYSRVRVKIKGGRTHQIRVHMAGINHPIKGDILYGDKPQDRLYLHFFKITFVHPRTLTPFTYTCKTPF